jgi:hypothetical protein
MGALTIAFDTTIVGALALPWVFLVMHIFFSQGENHVKQSLTWVNQHGAQVPAGILLFAMTYTLGSVVSRIAQDFFNDDDIHFRIHGQLFRWPITEDRIRARVYCDDDRKDLLPNVVGNTALAKAIDFQKYHNLGSLCPLILRGWVETGTDKEGNPDRFVKTAADIFGLEENTLMDKGGDYSARLRQLHDQIMVLRGAAFNGVIGFSLCLFAWGAVVSDHHGRNGKSKSDKSKPDKSRSNEKPRPWVRWVLMPVPIFYLATGIIALSHHIKEKSPEFPPDPPYMEFTLLLLAGAGVCLLWPPSPPALRRPLESGAGETRNHGKEDDDAVPHWRIERWGRLVALSLILTFAAFLGWWSTEVIYRDQVIYSYDSQFADTLGATVPSK